MTPPQGGHNKTALAAVLHVKMFSKPVRAAHRQRVFSRAKPPDGGRFEVIIPCRKEELPCGFY